MRAAALLVALLALTASAQDPRFKRFTTRTDQGRNSRGLLANSLAFFEAFNGAGTTTACSTTAPTGAKGEALTFTRTGNGTCTKTATGGLATSGIADGDLVVLSGNQPRVEYDSNGVLGLLVESARTNSCLRSQELNNAAWTGISSGVAAPTLSADQAVAPDGTTTAERMTVPAVTAAQYSLLSQSIVLSSTTSASVYIKGNGTSGTICLALDNASANNKLCSYNSTTWTRCQLENQSLSAAAHPIYIGNYGIAGGACAGAAGAQDVFVWGTQVETGGAPYATSYIPTGAGTATRNAETANFTVSWPSTAASISVAATASGYQQQQNAWWASAEVTGGFYVGAYATTSLLGQASEGRTATGTAIASVASTTRAAVYQSGTTISLVQNGATTSQTAGAATSWTPNKISIGNGFNFATYHVNSVISRVCADPDPSRCR